MRLLYLDDSGTPNDARQNYVILGGVCVSDAGVRWLSNELDKIAQCIDPQSPNSVEFHACDIFAGRNHPWDKINNKSDRIEIIKRVLHVLDSAFDTTTVFATAIQKQSYPNNDPVLLAYEEIAQLFNNHLEYDCEPIERGLIIIDKTSYETGLQNLAAEIRKNGNRLGYQNRSIIEIPMFVDSKVARLVQLADHIAYAVYRYYNAADMNYFNIIGNRFILKDGKMRTLSHRSNNYNTCTCPACITRKR